MNHQLPQTKFLISGTMRGGSSLISNIFNAHSEVMVLGEYVHFFRFIYKHYDPFDAKNAQRMLEEIDARLYHRYKVSIDKDAIFKDIKLSGFTYISAYDAIMRYYLNILDKKIAGEDAAINWTTIPEYLSLFPDAKVIQICRDPRSVLASWHKASYQKIDYLDAIFNLIDNLDKCSYYRKIYSSDRYTYVKYEDLVLNPEREVRRLCDFVGIEFEPLQIQPHKWNDIFDGVYVKRGWSSQTGKTLDGFDSSRMEAWKNSLEDWELCLCEWLAKDRMIEFGYELSGKKFDTDTVYKGIDALRNSPFLYKRFTRWLASNQGAEGYPDDPRDPLTWGAAGKNKELFIYSDDGKAYLNAMEKIKAKYEDQRY